MTLCKAQQDETVIEAGFDAAPPLRGALQWPDKNMFIVYSVLR